MKTRDPLQTTLIAGAHAYAESFGRVPPERRDELEAELDDLATEIRNAVVAALWAHPYPAFREAVRRELLHAVPDGGAR